MCEFETGIMTAADVDAVCAIEEATFARPWSRASIENELTNSCARYVVLRRSGETVGYAGMWLVIDEAHVCNVAVHPDYRRRGYGRRIFEALMALAQESGMAMITLEVRRSNLAAQSLYHACGMLDVGYRKRYYEDNREDALIMYREFSGAQDGTGQGG